MLNREASLGIQQAFLKPCLVILTSEDNHLVFYFHTHGFFFVNAELYLPRVAARTSMSSAAFLGPVTRLSYKCFLELQGISSNN